jgi:hypothetical protein
VDLVEAEENLVLLQQKHAWEKGQLQQGNAPVEGGVVLGIQAESLYLAFDVHEEDCVEWHLVEDPPIDPALFERKL